jgi:prolyl-tRNA editing enzyme YbaK/EbsC (Cys-tRNA(Pro) deacylase)
MQNTSSEIPQSAKKVQVVLVEKGYAFELKVFSSNTRTAQEAAETLGCEVSHIVKSLLFRTIKGHHPILVLINGKDRVNEKKLSKLVGEMVEKAPANFTRDITGFAIGGIPPVGHQTKIDRIFIDETLLDFEILWAAAGTPNSVFHFQSKDIQGLTGGQMVSILNKESEI